MVSFLINPLNQTQNNVPYAVIDRSKTRIFWITLERLVSQRFSLDIRVLFQNRFIPKGISYANTIFFPPGVKRGVKRGQLPISPNIIPQKLHICREIISHEKFDTVTLLGQITNSDPF